MEVLAGLAVCCVIGSLIGAARGRRLLGWLLGLLLGPIGWLIVLTLPDARARCRECGAVLNRGARRCAGCGESSVVIASPASPSRQRRAWPQPHSTTRRWSVSGSERGALIRRRRRKSAHPARRSRLPAASYSYVRRVVPRCMPRRHLRASRFAALLVASVSECRTHSAEPGAAADGDSVGGRAARPVIAAAAELGRSASAAPQAAGVCGWLGGAAPTLAVTRLRHAALMAPEAL